MIVRKFYSFKFRRQAQMRIAGFNSWWRFAFALIAVSVLLACDNSQTQAPPASSEQASAGATPAVYRMQFGEAPSTLDPLKASSAYANTILINVYDTLYRYQFLAEPFALTPNLASAMPNVSADGLTLTIKLKHGVYFQDSDIFPKGKGREVRASDVVYSLKRHFVPNNFSDGAWQWQDYVVGVADWQKQGAQLDQVLEGLQALDNYTVQIKLKQAMPTLLNTLATGYAAVLPAEAVTRWGKDLASHAVGSGPFQLESFTSNKVVLIRNRNFRKETIQLADEGYVAARHQAYGLSQLAGLTPPLLDRIEINFISDNYAALLALQRADLDAAKVGADALPRLFSTADDINGQVKFALLPEWRDKLFHRATTELGSVFISFNMLDPDIGFSKEPSVNQKHQALRCAIAKAYSWQKRNAAIYLGSAQNFRGVIPPGVPGFEEKNLEVPADLEAAKALLTQAGYTAELLPVLKYGSTGSAEQRKIFELFRAQMLALGYPQDKIQWQSYPSFGAFIEAINRSEVMLQDMGWQMDVPDAENVLQLYYGPYKAPQVNNANYQNPQFDALFEKARTLAPGPERTRLQQQMNQMVIDDCVVISGATRSFPKVWSKRFIAWPDNDSMAGRGLRFVAPITITKATGTR